MSSSTAVCDWGRAPAEQIEDAGRPNSPSAIRPTEDDEMRRDGRVIQVGSVVELLI